MPIEWVLPILALTAALVAVFDKSYQNKRFHISRIGIIASIVAILTAVLTIIQNIDEKEAALQSRHEVRTIREELLSAQGQRDNLLKELESAEDSRDRLQKKLNAAHGNIIFNKDRLTESVIQAKELSVLLSEAKIKISKLESQINAANEALGNVQNRLDNVILSHTRLLSQIGTIQDHVVQAELPIVAPQAYHNNSSYKI